MSTLDIRDLPMPDPLELVRLRGEVDRLKEERDELLKDALDAALDAASAALSASPEPAKCERCERLEATVAATERELLVFASCGQHGADGECSSCGFDVGHPRIKATLSAREPTKGGES